MKTSEACHVESTYFHNQLASESYPFESGRYWLFSSKLCPFAHRTEIVRSLAGLTEHIGLTIAGSIQNKHGWNLDKRYKSAGSEVSPIPELVRLPELYELAEPGYTGRCSVPVLFDTKTNTIVNNESAEIIRQLDQIAVDLTHHQTLYPIEERKFIDERITGLVEQFINPIYRAGFAKEQQTYLTNFQSVFAYLNKLEQWLRGAEGPYLVGGQVTLADVYAYPHLSRFDAVYHSLYRLNLKFVRDYPHIASYLSRLGQIPAFVNTLDIEEAKQGYFLSWNQPTNGYFIPVGPIVDSRSGVAN